MTTMMAMLCVTVLLLTVVSTVDAHGYLLTPRSRNLIANEEGVWSSGGSPAYPKETCPHCLNLGGSLGRCGVIGKTQYDIPRSIDGEIMPANPDASYERGGSIVVDVLLTAHHKGHFEFNACAISGSDEAPSQACFDASPLMVKRDLRYGAPVDADFPERAYIPPLQYATVDSGRGGTLYSYELELPEDLEGGLVLLQWHYLTANSCDFEGYDSYAFPSAWGNMGRGPGRCGEIPEDGRGNPEQFWNCAEISIGNGGSTKPRTPAPTFTVPPPTAPVMPVTSEPYPTFEPSASPVDDKPTAPEPPTEPSNNGVVGTCGGNNVGNGVCADPRQCCSQWGYCGTSDDHCNDRAPVSAPKNAPSQVAAPSRAPIEPSPMVGTCGGSNVGNGYCEDLSLCCSQWGYCGSSDDHCNDPAPKTTTPISTPTAPTGATLQTPPTAPTGSIRFPDYASGNCDKDMKINFGYYQSWAIWRENNCNPVYPKDIDVDRNGYTHLAYTFASINEHHELEPWGGDYFAEVEQMRDFNAIKEQYPQLRTLIAVGGWTFNEPTSATTTRFSDTAATAERRSVFADSVVRFLKEHDFDGIDLDWEYPGDEDRGGSFDDKENYALLVHAIRDAFDDEDDEDYLITMAIPASPTRLSTGYDLDSLSSSLDFLNLMAYDIYGAWGSGDIQGANADMPYIFDSVAYLLNKDVPSEKIVLGLAGYGRSYNMASGSCTTMFCEFTGPGPGGCAGEPGFMPYFSIDEYVQSGNYDSIERLNIVHGAAELVIDGNILISYDSPESLNVKASFAAETCMGGVFWWAVDMIKEPLALGTNSGGNNPSPVLGPTTVPVWSPTGSPLNDPTQAPIPEIVSMTTSFNDWVVSTEGRCGTSEVDARGNCRKTCRHDADCDSEHWCWGVHANYCGSKPQPDQCLSAPQGNRACGTSELMAREMCGTPCLSNNACAEEEACYALHLNYCQCGDGQRKLRDPTR